MVYLDGYEFEHVEFENRHFLFGNDTNIVVVGFSLNDVKAQARETLDTVKQVKAA